METFSLTPYYQPSTSAAKVGSSARVKHPGNKFNTWNTLIAYTIQREMAEAMQSPDRGLRRARFAVLKDVPCPAVLVEGGFISNAHEGGKLAKAEERQKLAQAIAAGISRYQKIINDIRGL